MLFHLPWQGVLLLPARLPRPGITPISQAQVDGPSANAFLGKKMKTLHLLPPTSFSIQNSALSPLPSRTFGGPFLPDRGRYL